MREGKVDPTNTPPTQAALTRSDIRYIVENFESARMRIKAVLDAVELRSALETERRREAL